MAALKKHSSSHAQAVQSAFADTGRHILIEASPTLAVYRDPSGGRIVLTGRGFEFDEGAATAGTVTGATFIDQSGSPYLAWGA